MSKMPEEMTIAELDEVLLGMQNDIDARKEACRQLRKYRSERSAKMKIDARLAAMSDDERRALLQHVAGAGGVASGERVGRPGG